MKKLILAAVLAAIFTGLFYTLLCVYEWQFPLGDRWERLMRIMPIIAFCAAYLGLLNPAKKAEITRPD